MALRLKIVGRSKTDRPVDLQTDLLTRAIEVASGSRISHVEGSSSDLTVVYPYVRPFKSTVLGAGFESLQKRLSLGFQDEDLLRYFFRVHKSSRLLVVSPENLDRRPWESLGHSLIQSNIPRLTFWPQELDPRGFRFPYWWNYVDWPQIPRPNFGRATRFGMLYDLQQLGSEAQLTTGWGARLDKAVWLTQHMDFPRRQVLQRLSRQVEIDVLSNVPHGKKIHVLRRYKYCVVTENSTGYGYETEKTPDAVSAGCIPIGFIANPWSDFNPAAVFFDAPSERPSVLPALLSRTPDLQGLLNYLGSVLQ